MSYRLIIRKKPELQLAEAFEWYEKQRASLGLEFLQSVETTLTFIENNPLLFQIRYKNIRSALTPHFPYGIFYFVEENTIVVVAVFHLSRNPKRWKND